MNQAESDKWRDLLVDLVRHLDAQDKELARRISELEARPSLEFCGVFEPGRSYRQGGCVTSDGSLFVALIDSPDGRPGKSGAWRLACKRGRDGRDGRAR